MATEGEWEGVREPSDRNMEAVLPRPHRSHPRSPTPTTPAPILIQMSPCTPKLLAMRIQIVELSELWKSKESHSKIMSNTFPIFLQILSINVVKTKSKNNSHVRYLLNFQSKKKGRLNSILEVRTSVRMSPR